MNHPSDLSKIEASICEASVVMPGLIGELRQLRRVKQAAEAWLKCRDAIVDSNDRGQDDSGERATDSFAEYRQLDADHDNALAAFREALARLATK